MSQLSQFLNAWKVRSIEVLPDNEGVEVEFVVEGHEPFRFRTRKFGIGKRGARSAALAKFASRAGYGEVEELFRHIVSLPRDTVGGIFYPGPVELPGEPQASPVLTCLWSDEVVC